MKNTPQNRTASRRAALRAIVESERSETPLFALLDQTKIAPNERGFARELCGGVMRNRARIDWSLEPLLKKPLQKLDSPVREALRLALYEKLVLATPLHVVADEYAGLMRGEKLGSAVGFVNAVARKLPATWRASPDKTRNPAPFLAVEYSHPQWIVERYLARFGFEQTEKLLQINNTQAPLCLRVNTLKTTRDRVLEALRNRGLQARAGDVSPDAIWVLDAVGSPENWPEWTAGEIIAQDEAAQIVARVLSPKHSWKVVDAASAPGGKTTHLAQLMNDEGAVLACDRSESRLKLVRENARRLDVKTIETRALDFRNFSANATLSSTREATVGETKVDETAVSESNFSKLNIDKSNGDEITVGESNALNVIVGKANADEANAREEFDAVLLDAPCLGTGTWRRRPDARWRKTPAQLAELVQLQRELLDVAASAVKIGGVLVYSTCSLEPEENEAQIHAFLSRHRGWKIDAEVPEAAREINALVHDESGFWRTAPHIEYSMLANNEASVIRPDGMFAARLVRVS